MREPARRHEVALRRGCDLLDLPTGAILQPVDDLPGAAVRDEEARVRRDEDAVATREDEARLDLLAFPDDLRRHAANGGRVHHAPRLIAATHQVRTAPSEPEGKRRAARGVEMTLQAPVVSVPDAQAYGIRCHHFGPTRRQLQEHDQAVPGASLRQPERVQELRIGDAPDQCWLPWRNAASRCDPQAVREDPDDAVRAGQAQSLHRVAGPRIPDDSDAVGADAHEPIAGGENLHREDLHPGAFLDGQNLQPVPRHAPDVEPPPRGCDEAVPLGEPLHAPDLHIVGRQPQHGALAGGPQQQRRRARRRDHARKRDKAQRRSREARVQIAEQRRLGARLA
mmetsp:Transcript_78634/g.220380  ORF Transcript_78634/g.220380 Transcript_78634/m.220380 type:complete len:338 (+) Transcript_78634:230-1243(+)